MCDYCLNKCTCNKGFGAKEDVFNERSKPGDCLGRICPTGPSFTNFRPEVRLNTSSGLPNNMDRFSQSGSESSVGADGEIESAIGGRVLAECSGVVSTQQLVGLTCLPNVEICVCLWFSGKL